MSRNASDAPGSDLPKHTTVIKVRFAERNEGQAPSANRIARQAGSKAARRISWNYFSSVIR
jgi:hypothetical protein